LNRIINGSFTDYVLKIIKIKMKLSTQKPLIKLSWTLMWDEGFHSPEPMAVDLQYILQLNESHGCCRNNTDTDIFQTNETRNRKLAKLEKNLA
jgi:hypothetical protein